MKQEVGPELYARVDGIRAGIARAGAQFDPALAERAEADLDRVIERLDLGVDHAVVALVGGTGSGKSSTFNALTTLDFADVGVIRPTTSDAAACVWGDSADRLLDFLQVKPERRIQRESVLTGTDEAELRGLVLLDLPDHDSIATGHAELVNRLLPLIDLLIWVVDPQKYADNALHEGYLRELQERHEAMLVVVNQVDTLTESGQAAVRDDIGRLLADDGLSDVPVILASARTGEGIDRVRQHLRSMMASESIAARTARDEISAVIRRIRVGMGSGEPDLAPAAQAAAEVSKAAGIPAIAAALRSAIAAPGRVTLAGVRRPARSRIDAIRESWLGQATDGLPQRWRSAIFEAAAPAADFYQHTSDALADVPQPSGHDVPAARMRVLGFVGLGIAVVLGVVAGVLWQQPPLPLVLGAAAIGCLVIGLVLVLMARVHRRRLSLARSGQYQDDVITTVGQVVADDLVVPTAAVLADHETVRHALAGSAAR
ncbi:MAG: GTP-binding protein [Beutenbergiaceae bacterium]